MTNTEKELDMNIFNYINHIDREMLGFFIKKKDSVNRMLKMY